MWLRRAFYGWLIPAAFLLPVWLFIGWGVFNAGGWAFLWVLLLAVPSVLVGQLLLTLLVRARGTVRAQRAVSWWDVLGFTIWHLLIISLGFYAEAWWAQAFVVTVFAAVGLFWLELWQLWREAQPSRVLLRTNGGMSFMQVPAQPETSSAETVEEVFVVTEKPPASQQR
ncbi:MFS transporter permease (plasmid) [Coraliomargarita sp. W4R53]